MCGIRGRTWSAHYTELQRQPVRTVRTYLSSASAVGSFSSSNSQLSIRINNEEANNNLPSIIVSSLSERNNNKNRREDVATIVSFVLWAYLF